MPDPEQESAAYQRSPVDALHLAVAAAGFLLCLVLAVGAKNTMVGVEADLLQLVDRVPSALAVFLVGLVQLVAVVAPPVVLAVTLVLRRFRLALLLVTVPVAAALLEEVVAARLGRLQPPLLERALTHRSYAYESRGGKAPQSHLRSPGSPGPPSPAPAGSPGRPPPPPWPAPG